MGDREITEREKKKKKKAFTYSNLEPTFLPRRSILLPLNGANNSKKTTLLPLVTQSNTPTLMNQDAPKERPIPLGSLSHPKDGSLDHATMLIGNGLTHCL